MGSRKSFLGLGLLVIGAFLLRVIPQLDKVFVDGTVWFRGMDAWYHMRLVDSMMVNFPSPLRYDNFAVYPTGAPVGYLPLMHWLIVSVSKLGFNCEYVAAFLPPIVGALILIPIYLLGKELFNNKVGLIACFLCAIIPGELFHRSLLGFTDHHILESFLMVTTVLFIILAYRHKRFRYWVGAGVSLGLYMLNWSGGPLLVFIIFLWFLTQYLIDSEVEDLCEGVGLVLLTGVCISAYFLSEGYLTLTAGLAVLPLILLPLRRHNRFILVSIIVAIGAYLLFFTTFGRFALTDIRGTLWGFGTTIEEAVPLTLKAGLSIFGVSFFLMFGGLYFCIKNKVSLPFTIWAVILIAITFGQRRWGYYSTIPISLLSAYLIYIISLKVKENVRVSVIVVMCFFLVMSIARQTIHLVTIENTMSRDWYNTCIWVRENTPEGADYGVLSWWDYGHWIIRIAHRAPVSSPTYQDPPVGSRFFTVGELDELNIRYVIIDEKMLAGKWYAICEKAGADMPVEESVAYKLWNNKLEGWELIHDEQSVKVFTKAV